MYEESIIINQEEVSVASSIDSSRLTAMVIEAERGPISPVMFSANSEEAIKTMFGEPSTTNQQVLGAILANRNSNLLVSAPDTNGVADAVWLTNTGLFADDDSGVKLHTLGTLGDVVDNAGVVVTVEVGTGDGTLKTFTKADDAFKDYDQESLKLVVGSVELEPNSFNDTKTKTTFLFTGYTVEVTKSTSTVSVASEVAVPAAEEVSVKITNSVPVGSMALFYTKYTGDSGLILTATYDKSTNTFGISISSKTRSIANYRVSLIPGSKDGYGIPIFAEDVFRNSKYIGCQVYGSVVPDTFPTETQTSDFKGGIRGAIDDDALNAGLLAIEGKSTTNIDIFCDVTEKNVVLEKYQVWSKSQWRNSTYMVPVPANTIDQVEPWITSSFRANDKIVLIANRGIYTLTNYKGGVANLSCTADLVRNLVIGNQLFDAAPIAGYSDGRGYGGILTGPLVGLTWDLTADQRLSLSKQYINPIVQDPQVGYLCYSQKTGKLIEGVTDTVPVMRATNYIRRGLINTLKYYVQRWNESEAITEIELKIDNLLSAMVGSSPQIVSSYEISFDSSVNTPLKRAQGILAGKIVVTFNNIIEKIEIAFTITDGSVDLS